MSINKYYDIKTPERTCLYRPTEINDHSFKEKNTVYIIMMVLYFNKMCMCDEKSISGLV